MDRREHMELMEVLAEAGLSSEYEITPEPRAGEDVPFFDILSEAGPLQPAAILNTLRTAITQRGLSIDPKLIAAQKYCLSFEDLHPWNT